MINFLTGNIFDSEAQALVNTVNLVGVMGKGVALQFKNAYPDNYKAYRAACSNGQIAIGKLFVTETIDTIGRRLIINFPTKTDWRKSSEYEYISQGLEDLKKVIARYDIKSISMPPLGAGNGGLHWDVVKSMISDQLKDVNIEINVYEPSSKIVEHMKAERVKLTSARALLLYILFDLVRHGEYVSEFSSEKVCYFLQKCGAEDIFRLRFEPRYYGPYSGKVRYVLNALNGSYLMGYSAMDKKPFEMLTLVSDSYPEIEAVVNSDPAIKAVAIRTMALLDGFYSDYGLELLSSVDYLLEKEPLLDSEGIYSRLNEWSHRKGVLFSNIKHVEIARQRLLSFNKVQKSFMDTV